MHIVTAENSIIISYDITHVRCHDAPIFEQICGTLPHGSDHMMLDAAYHSRNICSLIEKIGRIPVIIPRKGVRVRGFDAMGIRWHRDNPDEFLSIYYKRSNVEATFSSMKRRFSSTLSARKFATQKIELEFFVLCHNIHILSAAV